MAHFEQTGSTPSEISMKNSETAVTRRHFLAWTGAVAGARLCPALAVGSVEIPPQPYFAGVNRTLEALAKLGAPMTAADVQQIASLTRQNDSAAVNAAERILDRYTLATLSIGPDGSSRVVPAGAPRKLVEQGWRMFLVRVDNPSSKHFSSDFTSVTSHTS